MATTSVGPRYDDYDGGVDVLLPAAYDVVWSLVAFALPLLVVAALVTLVVLLVRRNPPATSDRATAARRHGIWVNLAAWAVTLLLPGLLGPLVGFWLFGTLGPVAYASVVVGVVPGLAGLLFVGTHALGERTWPRPVGPVRRASLTPRRVGDTAPSWLRGLLWSWAGLLAVALVAFGVTARADGRALVHVDGTVVRTGNPYPGWPYGVGLLVAAALVVAATEATLRLVASRPAVLEGDPGYDAASRRLSAHRVLRGAQLVVGLMLGGVLVTAGGAIRAVELGALGTAVGASGVVVALVALGAAVVPAQPPLRSGTPSVSSERPGADARPR